VTRFVARAAASLTFAAAFFALAAAFGAPLAGSSVAQAAAGDFVFTGRGWGHGTGMSQWGAWQAAREGVAFDEILAFYYPGTILQNLNDPDRQVKVRISSQPWSSSNTTEYVQIDLKAVQAPMTLLKHTAAGDELEVLPTGSFVSVVRLDGKVQLVTAAGPEGPFDYVELKPETVPAGAETDGDMPAQGRGAVQLKTTSSSTPLEYREYWGTLRVQPAESADKLWLYNFVALEQYVRSIAEVDYDWAVPGSAAYAFEAVKAQAVAARTYAVAKTGTLADNQNDQCYRGYSFEARYPGIARAAEETAGLVVTYQNQPIKAYFSAHSGGYITNSAWSGSVPAYIVSKPDPWSLTAPPAGMNSAGPGFNWTYTISANELSAKVNGRLKDVSTGKTIDLGLLGRVEVATRDTSDPGSHAKTLKLTGANGIANVSASSFRALFGYSSMRSTLILSVTGGQPLTLGEFYDVGAGHPYHDQIAQVATEGLMGGYDSGLFMPDGSVTRWQFAKIAVNLHNLTDPANPITVVDVEVPPFGDVPVKKGVLGDESDWVAAAKNAGLVAGVSSTSFQPYSIVRRDQMATMLCRALGWDGAAQALPAGTPSFVDVPHGAAHWAQATYLKERGIILGYPDPSGGGGTMLRVEEPIKRQHVAVILCRVLDLGR